jgi:hypothetical protein
MRTRTVAAVMAAASLAACGVNERETLPGVDAQKTSARRTEVDAKPLRGPGVDGVSDSAGADVKTTSPRDTPRRPFDQTQPD